MKLTRYVITTGTKGCIDNRFYQNFGNCSIVPLKLDLAGDLDVENGRIHSPDPMRIFFTDQKFAYNGIVIFTSILQQ